MRMLWALLALVSVQAQASDDVTVETFDGRAVGTSIFDISNAAFMFKTRLSGGQVAVAAPDWQPYSGSQVYTGTGGTPIELRTEDEDQFSWPGVGAWVSGTDTITLQAYEFDENSSTDIALGPVSVMGGAVPVYLSIGSLGDPRHITYVTFSSDAAFAIDDLTLGIEGIGPGIPEPAAWALMVLGFGAIGASLRYRSRAIMAA